MKPTIHSNGSSPASLLDEAEKALRALSAAQDALPHPDGRDYYPQGPEATTAARAKAQEWRRAIAQVHAEVEAYAIHIYDAAHGKR